MLKVAVVPLIVPVPNVTAGAAQVPPSIKVTVPVHVPVAGETADTVAVKITDCPVVEGLGDAERDVVVFPLTVTTAWVAIFLYC